MNGPMPPRMDAHELPRLLDASPTWLQELLAKVEAGLQSLAEDLGATRIGALEMLILHPAATYVMPALGESMTEPFGLGTLLVGSSGMAWGMKHEGFRPPIPPLGRACLVSMLRRSRGIKGRPL